MTRTVFILLSFSFIVVCCTDRSASTTIDQFKQGQQLYTTYCASCHEVEGGIGPVLSKKVLATRVNAKYLYNYNKANMPYEAGNTLPEKDYWDITAYLLIREGFMDSTLQLNSFIADSITLAIKMEK